MPSLICLQVLDESWGVSHEASLELFVEVVAVNDGPVLRTSGMVRDRLRIEDDGLDRAVLSVSPLKGLEDTVLRLLNVSVRDVDVGEDAAGMLSVHMTATHGTMSLTYHTEGMSSHPSEPTSLGSDLTGLLFSRGSGYDDAQLSFRATLDDVNRALAGLSFHPEQDYHGTGAGVSIQVDDGGACGSEDPEVVRRGQLSIPIHVAAVNDPPLISLPTGEDGAQVLYVDEGQTLRLSGTFYHNLSSTAVSALGYTSATGFELWRSELLRPDYDDGEWGEGHMQWRYDMVSDIFAGQDSSNPRFFCEFQDLIYFQVRLVHLLSVAYVIASSSGNLTESRRVLTCCRRQTPRGARSCGAATAHSRVPCV